MLGPRPTIVLALIIDLPVLRPWSSITWQLHMFSLSMRSLAHALSPSPVLMGNRQW